MSRYSIFKRGKIYYAQIKNPEIGKYFPAKSTGKTDESEALLVVSDWLHNGLPEKTNLQQSIDINTIYYTFRTVQLNMELSRWVEKSKEWRGGCGTFIADGKRRIIKTGGEESLGKKWIHLLQYD